VPTKQKEKDKNPPAAAPPQMASLGPLQGLFNKFEELELQNVTIDVDEFTLIVQPAVQRLAAAVAAAARPTALLPATFKAPLTDYPGQIREITIGATKSQGGTRSKALTIGGHKAPAWNLFQARPKHLPIVAGDVFDMRISLAKAVKVHYDQVMDDPAG